MRRFDMILAEYREADLNKKLHLFLEFADLRKDFQEIDRAALKRKAGPDGPKLQKIRTGSSVMSLLRGSVEWAFDNLLPFRFQNLVKCERRR